MPKSTTMIKDGRGYRDGGPTEDLVFGQTHAVTIVFGSILTTTAEQLAGILLRKAPLICPDDVSGLLLMGVTNDLTHS